MRLPERPPKPWLSLRRKHPINPPPPSPRRSRELSSAPEEEEQRQEEVNSRVSRPEVAQTQEHPFSTAILAEALPAGVKVSNLSEYDGTGDPQEHLDKFYAKIDWYDLSDAAYCKRQPPHSRGYRRDFGRPSRRGFRQCKESPGSRSQENNWQTPNQIHNINSDKQGEIAFGEQDLDPMRNQNNDALVISATLSNFWVKKVLVDSGSSADIIFYDAYVQLGVDNAQLRKVLIRKIHQNGEVPVVKAPSAYNIILGRPSLNLFRAIASTFHMKLKFPTSDGGEAVGDERMARECYANTLKRSREN
ncbi:UNVERIFIED_CONTAM: hypothetical protein Scaly_2015800 [Sesamum calycinum]|uniref:Uncharacterized protein n=1 Tax=Sesamum calycinum TaxID=2727403 RepID=A0AAW2N3P0_9LAMI